MNDNARLISNYIEALNGKPKPLEVINQYVADPQLIQHILAFEAAFPSYRIDVEETVAERDLVVLVGTANGTHKGPFAGIEPTGKTFRSNVMLMYRILDGKIANFWMQFDMVGLLQQLRSDSQTVAA